ncbi:MAG: geranylgeranylglyceryl/heptaprenylglyceryl phosphate synthase [Marinilabiliaceae bacterium]|nr:geranylgeranylglyceryl/heptaprenylglyceryl phosphate synthase [Marinilabiliaceae bacterium]
MTIQKEIYQKVEKQQKQIAFLIDPDKYQNEKLDKAIEQINLVLPDMVMIGGSLVSTNIEPVINKIKKHTSIPVIIYPGSLLQLSNKADAILFISLISGRNPDFLIGNHVVAAPLLKKAEIEVISTGYVLIDGGCKTSVEYMSNTQPIPSKKNDIAIATALAGELLGMKMIYLDAGSGALNPVPPVMVQEVKKALQIPLMIGGGLNTPEKVENACRAGADIVVIGNAVEKDISLLNDFVKIVRQRY